MGFGFAQFRERLEERVFEWVVFLKMSAEVSNANPWSPSGTSTAPTSNSIPNLPSSGVGEGVSQSGFALGASLLAPISNGVGTGPGVKPAFTSSKSLGHSVFVEGASALGDSISVLSGAIDDLKSAEVSSAVSAATAAAYGYGSVEGLEPRLGLAQVLSEELEAVVSSRRALIAYLAEPFAGDYFVVHSGHQQAVVDLMKAAAVGVSKGPSTVAALKAALGLSVPVDAMTGLEKDATGALARLHRYHQALHGVRDAMKALVG